MYMVITSLQGSTLFLALSVPFLRLMINRLQARNDLHWINSGLLQLWLNVETKPQVDQPILLKQIFRYSIDCRFLRLIVHTCIVFWFFRAWVTEVGQVGFSRRPSPQPSSPALCGGPWGITPGSPPGWACPVNHQWKLPSRHPDLLHCLWGSAQQTQQRKTHIRKFVFTTLFFQSTTECFWP